MQYIYFVNRVWWSFQGIQAPNRALIPAPEMPYKSGTMGSEDGTDLARCLNWCNGKELCCLGLITYSIVCKVVVLCVLIVICIRKSCSYQSKYLFKDTIRSGSARLCIKSLKFNTQVKHWLPKKKKKNPATTHKAYFYK